MLGDDALIGGPGSGRLTVRDSELPIAGYAPFLIEGDEGGDSGPNLQHYLRVILKHWILIVACVIVAIGLGVVKTMTTQRIYTAAATIQIDKEAAQVVDVRSFEPREQSGYEEFFQTQYGLLKSRALAERTVDRLGLATDPSFLRAIGMKGAGPINPVRARAQAVGYLQGHLNVSPVQRSRLVSLSFDSPDPALSARIANGFAENFILFNMDRRFEASAYARRFLEERLAQVRTKLEQGERDLVAYAASQQLVNVSAAAGAPAGGAGAGDKQTSPGGVGDQSLASSSLAAANTALIAARGDRIRAEQRWRQAQSSAGAGLPEILQSAPVQALKSSRDQLEGEYQQKLKLYKPQFPEMVQLRARIDEIDRQINDATENVKASLKNQYEVALAQETAFAEQVKALTSSVLDNRERSIKYNILQRDVDTNRTLYDGLLQRYKEVGVAGGLATNNVAIIDHAQQPGGPSKPRPAKNITTAAVMGLMVGLAAAFLIELLDDSIRSPQDVDQKLGLPLLSSVPKLDKGLTPLEALADIRSPFSESYYSLRTALQFSTRAGAPRSLVVVSARPGEGKSTTALAIAQSLARIGSKVLLVDSDLRNPSLHRVLGIQNVAGLSNYLSSDTPLSELVQDTSTNGLSLMSSGPLPPSPAELLAGPRLEAFLAEAKTVFDFVIIDGPPVLGLADAPILASKAAGTLMVVETGRIGRNIVRSALRRLRMGEARVLGVVLTKVRMNKTGHGDYGYAYNYGAEQIANKRLSS